MIFIKYLPPVNPILVPKLKMLRIYWNLAYLIFRISQSRFWCQRLFLLNIYHLLGPNWSQNQKYLKFGTLDISNMPVSVFLWKMFFYQIFTNLLGLNWSKNEKWSEFLEIWLNWYFKSADLNFDVKNDFH